MKSELQGKIDSGAISSMTQLLTYVADRGWNITRNGAKYVGIETTKGKRFRVKFSFENPTFAGKKSRLTRFQSHNLLPGYCIYGLFAQQGEQRACYIGQTTNYLKRANDHFRGTPNRSSWDLQRWAEAHNSIVQFALLDFLPREYRSPETASEATKLEGLWLHRAQFADYLTPGGERWGMLPRPGTDDGFLWPFEEIDSVCRPLREVCEDQLLPTQIALAPVRAAYEKLWPKE